MHAERNYTSIFIIIAIFQMERTSKVKENCIYWYDILRFVQQI